MAIAMTPERKTIFFDLSLKNDNPVTQLDDFTLAG